VAQLGKHFAHAGIDGIVFPAFAVVTAAVIARQRGSFFFACLGEQCSSPLFNRGPDEALQRTLIAQVAGVDHSAQATENAGFGVRQGSVEVEDEGGKDLRHISSFAERNAAVLKQEGDRATGKSVFRRVCAAGEGSGHAGAEDDAGKLCALCELVSYCVRTAPLRIGVTPHLIILCA